MADDILFLCNGKASDDALVLVARRLGFAAGRVEGTVCLGVEDYLAGEEDFALQQAYEIGREAVVEGRSMLERRSFITRR